MGLVDRRYVVSIDKAIFKVFRKNDVWSIVPPRGGSPFQIADATIPTSSIAAGITDAITGANTHAAPAQSSNYPPDEPDYEEKLRSLHIRIVTSLNSLPADKSVTQVLTGPFRWTRRMHIKKSAAHTITETGRASSWRQVPVEPSWGKKALRKIGWKGKGTEDGV
jgi:hypothetical protein